MTPVCVRDRPLLNDRQMDALYHAQYAPIPNFATLPNSVRLVQPRNTRKRTLCGTEMAVEWGFHAFQPMIAHPKISAYGRRTHASEMPGGFLRADFGVPRMRVSVFSVVDTLRKSLTPRLGRDCGADENRATEAIHLALGLAWASGLP